MFAILALTWSANDFRVCDKFLYTYFGMLEILKIVGFLEPYKEYIGLFTSGSIILGCFGPNDVNCTDASGNLQCLRNERCNGRTLCQNGEDEIGCGELHQGSS